MIALAQALLQPVVDGKKFDHIQAMV